MSEMKLSYFNAKGRPELTRMLFKLAGKDFIDNRVEREDWTQMKPTTPKGQLPVLEVDGKMMCESMAIARFVAREYGLYGANNWEAAITDTIFESGNEAFGLMMEYKFQAKTEEEKKAKMDKLRVSLESLERIVILYKSGTFLLGEKPSFADAFIQNLEEVFQSAIQLSLDSYPTLKGLIKDFEAVPVIAEWIKSRPVTQY